MPLTLILGPMKSGKSLELIQRFAPLSYTHIPFALYQSTRNVRDKQITSRNGIFMNATKVSKIPEVTPAQYHIVGIDEIHMFPPEDIHTIKRLLDNNIKVIISGLDTDYQGKIFDIIRGLFELGPQEVIYKRAVCEICHTPKAVYSQVLYQEVPLTKGMPPVIPDDGTFTYQSVCRNCFVRE